jgi:glycerol-3-phosphate acyltransferase PlsX
MRIVVDAMGSDRFPLPDVEGAVQGAREYGETIILVGDETRIRPELAKYNTQGLDIQLVHTPEYVTMDDTPSVIGRGKPRSSMHLGTQMVRDGEADAFVTAGNTGAILVVATLHTLKRIHGVKRPTLTTILPLRGRQVILTDVGANADCKADWLVQFAMMGSIYAENALGIKNARIGLLSNGEEDVKGNALIQETSQLLRQTSLNFVGNVEPKEVLSGAVDVMVADGFVGNVMAKSMEAISRELLELIRAELMSSWQTKLGAWLASPAFRRVRKQADPFEIGGAPLLGVNGVVIVGHGRSNALAVKNMIRQARLAVNGKIIETIRTQLDKL